MGGNPRRKENWGAEKCTGGGKREGGKRDSQSGGKQEEKEILQTLHKILKSKKCKEAGADKNMGRNGD